MDSKLRLMCSYGGHIVPRPHDKSLIYAGGDTRLVSVHRSTASSTAALSAHLSASLHLPHHHNHHHLSIKYQLPDHDLDSLISVSTDEDLANMLDEYDRLSAESPPSRIRFFLFFGGGGGLHDLKTEGWFIDTLRSAGVEEREREREDSSIGSSSSSSFSGAVRVCGSGGGGGDDGVVVGSHFQNVKVVLPSVDSLGSDTSIPSPNFSQQAIVYQDASGFPESKPITTNLIENESYVSDRFPQSDMMSPVQVSGYVLSKPTDHPPQVLSPPPPTQHYVHHPAPQTHYINHYYQSSVPVASYPTMYQTYVPSQQPVQYQQINKPYPVYMMPVGQAQNTYAVPQTLTHSHSQPQLAPNPVMVASHMVYEGYNCKPAVPTAAYAGKVYGTTTITSQPVTGGTDDHKTHNRQFLAFPPQNLPSQPVAVTPLETTNYVSEFEDPMHAQIYKTQPPAPTLPVELQPVTKTETVMLSESLAQLQMETTIQ
ncbi:hypothetical protein RND81_08G224500 [Saponaria officinalis]|uniref:PB1 domain-containing protein n=1 Tax=Saponaria officinalis TaxID=3572 RepID=A0AAW1JAQ4_SAPOF